MNNKEANVLLSESLSVGRVIWQIVSTIIISIICGILAGILAIIPIIGWIGAIIISIGIFVGWISLIFDVIGMLMSKATLTECGIYGRSFHFGTFDLTFDQIRSINYRKGMITISYINAVGKKQKAKIYGIKNAKDFYQACNEQWAKATVVETVEA